MRMKIIEIGHERRKRIIKLKFLLTIHYKKLSTLQRSKSQFATVKTVAIVHLRWLANRGKFRCRKRTLQQFCKPLQQPSQL
jgi:hypothetical protein